ncbi:rhodanese-like domain-containing protein [Alkalihalophilus lindianensis]|uniref:Rhodanese-like domain-containing protein n=1 Tax=Alkalihalophilus lindianensis TaxID=1630542 RepID=A0ABU3XAS5_9BACI|nr:rhodanese-like domain-containing protein [Alkalihalophilus lindianensis]MDV2684987.1 rhodanese-like domain-containing protein [Alkalihalophilus lindianensis]
MSTELNGIKQVGTDELKAMLKHEESPIIIDVREHDEYEESHIKGVPLVPMHTIPQHLDNLDQSKSYVFVCRSGVRSQNVALYLKDHGFMDVRNYDGGMLSWDGEREIGLEWVIREIKELYR